MINFNHKPSCPDKENSEKVAKNIRKLAKKKLNKLEDLLTKRLNTKDMIPINLNDINDFPQLRIEDITTDIVQGSFKLRQSKSYIGELVKNGKAYINSDKLPKNLKNITSLVNPNLPIQLERRKEQNATGSYYDSRIIAVQFLSRFSRGEKTHSTENIRNVFIQYSPNVHSVNAIKGFK